MIQQCAKMHFYAMGEETSGLRVWRNAGPLAAEHQGAAATAKIAKVAATRSCLGQARLLPPLWCTSFSLSFSLCTHARTRSLWLFGRPVGLDGEEGSKQLASRLGHVTRAARAQLGPNGPERNKKGRRERPPLPPPPATCHGANVGDLRGPSRPQNNLDGTDVGPLVDFSPGKDDFVHSKRSKSRGWTRCF